MEERFFEFGNTHLKYQIVGEGKTLIFLHGIGVSSLTYTGCFKLLAQQYYLITPDLPGFGKSSVSSKAWDYDDYADFLNIFISSLNLKNIILVGHSFGGEIALRLATKNNQINELILIGTTGTPVRHSLLKLIYIILIKKSRTNWQAYKNAKQTLLMRKDFLINIFRKLLKLPRLVKTILKCIKSQAIINQSIKIKTLLLWAKKDEILSWSDEEALMHKFDNVNLQKLDEYHDWPLFKPELLLKELNNFINPQVFS